MKKDLPLDFTSLLDVIMILLFIVMGNLNLSATETKTEIAEAKDKIAELENEIQNIKDENYSAELFQSEVIILTVRNYERNGTHYLSISTGESNENVLTIQMGPERLNSITQQINNYINPILSDDNIVYIVFHLDGDVILRTEFNAVNNTFNQLQRNNKNVFYKEVEKESDV